MKKSVVLTLAAAVMLSGCGTYAGSGAYTGATLGSVLGSAIGGISSGPRGSDIGTIVGMAGGAIIGGAIGQKADDQRNAGLSQRGRDEGGRVSRGSSARGGYGGATYAQPPRAGSDDALTYDPSNSGDDRLYDFGSSDYTGSYTAQTPTTSLPATSSVEDLAEGMAYTPHIEIRNARIVDADQDGVISRGELCKVIFEVFNTGQEPVCDIQPTVVEASGNRHIFISPGMHVERLMPGAGIRYTAMLKADGGLKAGSVRVCLSVVQGTKAISKVTEFNVPTSKKRVAR